MSNEVVNDQLNQVDFLEQQTPVEDLSVEEDTREWFVLQCYSGQEYKVQSKIHAMIEDCGLQNKIFQVLIPEEEVIEIKNNQRVEKKVKVYPGYVFIQMILDDQVFFDVRAILGVSKFVGSKTKPTPVQEDDILKVLKKMGEKVKKVDVDFELGESIKVVSGPFRGYMGQISEINPEKGSLKSLISIFGRETPVQLDFDQVERVTE